METNVVKERLAFVYDLQSGHWSMSELCERYSVSRPTGYRWLARHQVGGGAGRPQPRAAAVPATDITHFICLLTRRLPRMVISRLPLSFRSSP